MAAEVKNPRIPPMPFSSPSGLLDTVQRVGWRLRRGLVARTVARVALLEKGGTASIGLALSAGGGDIPARVQALLKPASPRGRGAAIGSR
jgi:hypothetical protein